MTEALRGERYRVGIDVGGTFTDVMALRERDGKIQVVKVPSTPRDPAEGFLHGLRRVCERLEIDPEGVSFLVHGSTVGTNAVVQGTVPGVALVTTAGFRDVLEIARMIRAKAYDLRFSKARLLVPRRLRFEVRERIDSEGKVVVPLEPEGVVRIADGIRESGMKAVAVCLLFSFLNPCHEELVKEVLQKELPDCQVSLSSRVHAVFREYERTCITVLNIGLSGVMSRYFERIEQDLAGRGYQVKLHVMRQDGGFMGSALARELPIHTLVSGPTGGALAALNVGQTKGYQNLISLDMGGTTADICVIRDGRVQMTDQWEIGGYPLSIRAIEVNSIGAGGGSIAWVDTGGFLRVGPQSAGADPGPIAYSLGGKEITITDANLVLGRLVSDSLLNGEMCLDKDAVIEAMERLSRSVGIGIDETAEGIIRIAVANMARGIRVMSVERGHDLRDFTLVAFGGAGPMHALEIARELGIPRVIIPRHPGILSALGLLTADLKHIASTSHIKPVAEINTSQLQALTEELESKVIEAMREEGYDKEEVSFNAIADLRYVGQAYELAVPLESLCVEEALPQAIRQFHGIHKTRYGHSSPDQPLELVNVHVLGLRAFRKPLMARIGWGEGNGRQALIGSRPIRLGGSRVPFNVYQRDALGSGDTLQGPAVIVEYDSTTLVWQGERGCVDEFGNIVFEYDSPAIFR